MDSGARRLAGLPSVGLPHLILISLVAAATMSARAASDPWAADTHEPACACT